MTRRAGVSTRVHVRGREGAQSQRRCREMEAEVTRTDI